MVTIKEIASKAKVSVATVSYALNGKSGIGEKKKDEILRIANEMGYVPNSIARSLQSKSTNIIGVVIPHLTNSFNSELLVKLEKEARKRGYYLLLGSTENKIEAESSIIEKLIHKNIDALVIVPGNYSSEEFYASITSQLKKVEIPVVFVGTRYKSIQANYIALDLENVMLELTNLILTKNSKENILLFGGNTKEYYTRVRLNGIAKGHKAKDQKFPKQNQINIGGDYTFENGYKAIKKYLKNNAKTSGTIMAVNDLVAYGIIKGLKEEGFSIPQDFRVTGCDDIFIPTIENINLTTIKIPIPELAKLAIESVINNITNSDLKILQQVTLQLNIIKRDTA